MNVSSGMVGAVIVPKARVEGAAPLSLAENPVDFRGCGPNASSHSTQWPFHYQRNVVRVENFRHKPVGNAVVVPIKFLNVGNRKQMHFPVFSNVSGRRIELL